MEHRRARLEVGQVGGLGAKGEVALRGKTSGFLHSDRALVDGDHVEAEGRQVERVAAFARADVEGLATFGKATTLEGRDEEVVGGGAVDERIGGVPLIPETGSHARR